ncbi:hypothetical protein GCM10029964_060020 [Kibdelosporangium lantanae]
MTSTMGRSTRKQRFVLYGAAIAVVVVLAVVGLLGWRASATGKEARRKADQLVAALDTAGARTPSADEIVRLLGDDGGAVCAAPNDALTKATMLGQLANGSGGPGTRAVVADSRLVYGEVLVISIYCPDQLAGFQQFVSGLKTGTGAGG